tara:strand:- start:539 stop:2161 length:1623 start_codon:yes stop_codon:yes gene_type:complete
MPKRKASGKGGKGKGKKKKKKGAKDWSYYDDFGQDNDKPAITTVGGHFKDLNSLRDDEPAVQAQISSSDSEFDDSDSDVDTAYDELVASTTAIAASSSSMYSRLLKQQALEEDGKSDDSEEDSEEEEEQEQQEQQEQEQEQEQQEQEQHHEQAFQEKSTNEMIEQPESVTDTKSTTNSIDTNTDTSKVSKVKYDDPFVTRFLTPSCDEESIRLATSNRASTSFTRVETPPGSTLNVHCQSTTTFPTALNRDLTSGYRLKPRVATKWLSLEKKGSKRNRNGFTPLQSLLYPSINQYDDLMYMDRTVRVPKNKKEESCTGGSGWELREMLSLHIVNHITKARDAVGLHTKQIRKKREERKLEMNANQVRKTLEKEKRNNKQDPRKRKKKNQNSASTSSSTTKQTFVATLPDDKSDTPSHQLIQEEHRDQGLSRTRVLVILPTRSGAERYVKSILNCLPKTVKTIHNKRRFEVEYGLPEMAEEEEYENPNDLIEREKEILAGRETTRDGRRRQEDWIELFARNDNDCFTLGISFSRKEVKMYR